MGLPLPKVATLYTPLTHKASKAIASRMRVSLRPVMELPYATTHSRKVLLSGLERCNRPPCTCLLASAPSFNHTRVGEEVGMYPLFHSPSLQDQKNPKIFPPNRFHFPHPNHPPVFFFFFTPSTSSCCCCSPSLGKTFVLLKYSLTLPSRTSSSLTCVAVLRP